MKAHFDNVRAFAKFNAKPHLFSYGEPYQTNGQHGAEHPVFITLTNGCPDQFRARVEQFGGFTIGPVDLFEEPEAQPEALKTIVAHFTPKLEAGDAYDVCRDFLAAVQRHGFTFEYGLDGEPYNLTRAA